MAATSVNNLFNKARLSIAFIILEGLGFTP